MPPPAVPDPPPGLVPGALIVPLPTAPVPELAGAPLGAVLPPVPELIVPLPTVPVPELAPVLPPVVLPAVLPVVPVPAPALLVVSVVLLDAVPAPVVVVVLVLGLGLELGLGLGVPAAPAAAGLPPGTTVVVACSFLHAVTVNAMETATANNKRFIRRSPLASLSRVAALR